MTAYIYELERIHAPWRYALAFDYSPQMVAALKSHIPSRSRTWKSDIRQWWFKQDAQPVMLALAERHCGTVRHVQENGSLTPALPAATVAAYRTLHLLPSAPPEVVSAAYRALAKQAHPDVGGSTQTMQTINTAYALIQRNA